jgi:hypothetical protein
MTISRRRFIQAGGAAIASGASLSWALPALGKASDAGALIKDAEALYARSIVIDMLSEESLDDEGLKLIKDAAVTCFSPTLGRRVPGAPTCCTDFHSMPQWRIAPNGADSSRTTTRL